MKKILILLLLLTATAGAQVTPPFAFWKSGAAAPSWTPYDLGDSVKVFFVASDLSDSLSKSNGDSTYVLPNRARFNPFSLGNFYQLTDANKPLVHDSAGYWQVTFDGVNDVMDAIGGTYTQPYTIVLVMKSYKVPGSFLFYHGSPTSATTEAAFLNSATGINMDAGASAPNAPNISADSIYAFIETFNLASSSLDRNGIITTGNAGSEPMGGMRLMSRAAGGLNGAGMFRFILVLHRELTTEEKADLKTYLTNNFGANYP